MLKFIIGLLKVMTYLIIITNLLILSLGLIGVRLNLSESMDKGVYMVINKNLEKGDLVIVCEPKAKFFLKKKETVCGFEELLKRVVACPGDVISIDKKGISINGKFIKNSEKVNFNIPIDLFNNIMIDNYELNNDEYIILGDSKYSWDSRYYGVVKRKNIVDVVKLIYKF